jgi:hypothetical protein
VVNPGNGRLGRPSEKWDVEFEVPVVRTSVLWLQVLLVFLTAVVIVPSAMLMMAHDPPTFDYATHLLVLIPLGFLLAALSWRSFKWGRGNLQIQSNGIERRLVDTTGRDHLTVPLPACVSCQWRQAEGEGAPYVELFITLRDSEGYVILTITADSRYPPDGWTKGRRSFPSNAVELAGASRDSTAQTMKRLATLIGDPLG